MPISLFNRHFSLLQGAYMTKKEPPLAEQPKEGEREVRGQTGRKTWPFAPIV